MILFEPFWGRWRKDNATVNPSVHQFCSPGSGILFFCFCADADRRRAQFLQRMAPLCDGIEVDSVVDFFGWRWKEESEEFYPSIHQNLLPRLWYFFVRTQIAVEPNFFGGWRRSAMVVR